MYQHLSIFLTLFIDIFDIISLFAAELDEPKIGISGKSFKRTLSNSIIHPDAALDRPRSSGKLCTK